MRARELPMMLMVVGQHGLSPATEYDQGRFDELKRGTIVSVLIPPAPADEWRRRKFHAAISKLSEGVGIERERLRRELKLSTRQIAAFVADKKSGEIRIIPVSESGMDDIEFREYSEVIAAYVGEKYGIDFWELGKRAEPKEEKANG